MTESKSQKTAEIINPSLAEIDKVRDILFGKYVEHFQQKVTELESKLDADLQKMESKFQNKVDDLDQSLEQAGERLNHSIALLEDQMNSDMSELQKMMQAAEKSLHKELKATSDSLDDRKLNREALATLLDQVAVRLRAND